MFAVTRFGYEKKLTHVIKDLTSYQLSRTATGPTRKPQQIGTIDMQRSTTEARS